MKSKKKSTINLKILITKKKEILYTKSFKILSKNIARKKARTFARNEKRFL